MQFYDDSELEKFITFQEKRKDEIERLCKLEQLETIDRILKEDKIDLIKILRDRARWYTTLIDRIKDKECVYIQLCSDGSKSCVCLLNQEECIVKQLLDSFKSKDEK